MEKFLAQNLNIDNAYRISGPIPAGGPQNIGGIISTAVPFIFAIAGVGMLLMIISAGFTLMTSAGDAKKMESGKGRLTNAIVGFIIIFVAYWLVQLAGTMFGIEEITTIFQ